MKPNATHISFDRLREIISEEMKTVNEAVDHKAHTAVTSMAGKLLDARDKFSASIDKIDDAIHAFKESATPAMINAVTPNIDHVLKMTLDITEHLGVLESALETIVSTPGSYITSNKPKVVSLKPTKSKEPIG